MLYDPFMNTDIVYCDKALVEVLSVCSRRIMRARKVVRTLIRDPTLLLADNVSPPHGMHKYASEHHPVNRTSVELRKAIAEGLDISLRADPAASDGKVTFRFYDPNVNTYEKIKKMLHKSMSESIGESIGDLSSTTFKSILTEYLAERDGSWSYATADHNCCLHCQDLDLAFCAVEMELKVLEKQQSPDPEAIALKQAQVEEFKRAYDEHVGWDRMVCRHLKSLIEVFKKLEDEDMERWLNERPTDNFSPVCPEWRSRKARALLSHQDDMTKPNVPRFVQDSLSDLARYRPDVTAHVSAINGNAVVMSHELGGVQKNSGAIFESILIDHLLTCRGETLKIVWSDCAPVGRSFFLFIASMQYLVDSGFCDLALSGYMANCHGKYLADSLFGQWNRRARNENITSIDSLLAVFEKIDRSGSANVQGIIVNPVAAVEWQENLARLGYATSPPPEFGWEIMNPHYACAFRQSVRESLPADLMSLLEPLMPKHEYFVRITSWPRFNETDTQIPYEQRPVDVPAKLLRPRTAKEIGKGRPNDSEWYLCVPKSREFAESGPGVVPRSRAAKVGHNSSGYASQVALLRHPGNLRDLSWPSDFFGPPHSHKVDLKVAPENWIARKTLQRSSSSPTARYPPLNYYNALQGRPPREVTNRHKFEATYPEPPFPIIEGICAHSASHRLHSEFRGRLNVSVSVLDLYKAVRSEMHISADDEVDEYLQPRAKAASAEAREAYQAVVKEKMLRIKHRPVAKRSPFQIFRSDTEMAGEMRDLLSRKKQDGQSGATLASVSKQFWEKASGDFKKKYEDLVELEDDRLARELADYLKWCKERDDWLDSQGETRLGQEL